MSLAAGRGSGPALARLVGEAAEVQAAFEEMPVALCALEGPDFHWVAANAAYRAAFDREEFIGVAMRDALPDFAGQHLFEMVDQVYASGEPLIASEWRVQVEVDGQLEERYFDFELHPRRRADGTVRGILIQVVPVTDRVLRTRAAERAAAGAEERYRAVRDVIVELQEALLPTGLPVLPQVRVAARYLVAGTDQATGGDWFDAVALPDGTLALVVGDVVGHGVAASAAMGQARAVFDELLGETGDLEHALRRIDRLAARSPGLRAATLCAAVLDPAGGRLRYSTCGHPPPLVVGADGSARYLPASGGGPLGTGSTPAVAEEVLAAGEVLLLYSDGLIEQPGRPQDAGMRALAKVAGDAVANRALRAGAPGSTVERVCQQTVELLTRPGYHDDVTILAAERTPAAVGTLHLELTATPGAVRDVQAAVGDWLTPMELTADDARLIQMAATELVANVAEHAYPTDRPGPVRVRADLGADGLLELAIADDGRWDAPGPTPPDVTGRGLWMIGALTDELVVDHGVRPPSRPAPAGAGTMITIRHRLRRPAVLAAESASGAERRASMEFSTSVADGPPRTLRVTGSVDITTAPSFADRISTASRGGVHPLAIDLTDVDVLASAGISVLFAARDQHATHGHRLVLVAVPGSVAARLLDLVGLDHLPQLPTDPG